MNLILFSGVGGIRPSLLKVMAKFEELPDVGGGEHFDGFRTFFFMGMPMRVKDINGEPRFCLSDACKVLELKNVTEVRKRLRKDGLSLIEVVDTIGRRQHQFFVNEQNLYKLIMRSDKQQAEPFQDWVCCEVIPAIRKTGGYGKAKLPDFAERYKLNCNKIPYNFFSVLNELWMQVYKEFERVGYILPDVSELGKTLMPDISVGKCFAKYLRDNGFSEWNKCKKYKHKFADGRCIEALMYPLDLLPVFIRYVHEEWLPNRAASYLRSRDPKALEYLPKLLA